MITKRITHRGILVVDICNSQSPGKEKRKEIQEKKTQLTTGKKKFKKFKLTWTGGMSRVHVEMRPDVKVVFVTAAVFLDNSSAGIWVLCEYGWEACSPSKCAVCVEAAPATDRLMCFT